MSSLFNENHQKKVPLAIKCSPESLDEFFGQEKIIGKNGPLRRLIEEDCIPSSVFYGPAGCGKTALAKIIAQLTKSEFIRLNAVTTKVDDLRNALKRADQNRLIGRKTLLFIDEIHRFNKMVQDGLLPALEEGMVTLIGTTTKNPFFYLIPPLRSRILLFEFEKLTSNDLKNIVELAEKREGIRIDRDARDYLIRFSNGDARRMFNVLEASIAVNKEERILLKSVVEVLQKQPVLYDRDEDYHYDIISAYIKSIRGSDPDAALYWLSVMLAGGEDPLFIARRLTILASEDIGLADPLSLILAESAYSAVDKIGMPEGQIILSHITLYLSLQPKSNSSYQALSNAKKYVKTHESLDVPEYLRSTHPAARNYKYPHDYKYHYATQDYLKKKIQFYEPGELGMEKELKKRFRFLQQLKLKGEE